MELRGKAAIITGASGRLGSAIAKALAQAGCNCICHYNRNSKFTEELVRDLTKLHVKALAVGADLTAHDGVKNLFERALHLGTPQILINSAAVFSRQPLKQITPEQIRHVFDLNFAAPILACRAFAEQIENKFNLSKSVVGKIINISDIGGLHPWSEYSLYCASKAALISATKSLAKELAPAICVNSIAPGIVTWPADYNEKSKERQLSMIPLKRIADITEITEAVIFLLKNDYITGQVLNVDGGRCI